MRKKFTTGLVIATLMLGSLPVYAASDATLTSDIAHINLEKIGSDGSLTTTTWEDKDDAPGLRITIKDAYKRAGQTEKVILQLNGATWADGNGTSISIYDCKNIEGHKIALMSKGETAVQLHVDIPSDIEEGEEVSFVVPLLVRALKEEVSVTIQPGEDSELIEEETVCFGAAKEKKVSWEVGEIPTIIKEGSIADLTFTELRPGIIDDEVEITLRLQNSNLAFGNFDYIEESVHSDDTDYTVDTDDYVIYGGGFTGFSEKMIVKKDNKDDRVLTFRIKGDVDSEKGSITLTNIPIITKGSGSEEDILIALEGDTILNPQEDIVVGYMHTKTKEELAEEEAAKQEAIIAEEIAKQEQEAAQKGIRFKVGESNYSVDGTVYEMDATSFIQAPGYIMVPLKYVGLSLGIPQEDIQFNNGMIYFKYGERTIELYAGSDIAVVNKGRIQMEAPVVIIDGRSYAPMGEVARLLGLDREWNSAEKTAIFKMK